MANPLLDQQPLGPVSPATQAFSANPLLAPEADIPTPPVPQQDGSSAMDLIARSFARAPIVPGAITAGETPEQRQGAIETLASVAGGTATFIPTVLGVVGQTGIQNIGRLLAESELKREDITPEQRAAAKRVIQNVTPERTRELAEQTAALIASPIPEPRTPEGQIATDMVGRFFKTIMFWSEPLDEYLTEHGRPDLGLATSLLSELAVFKGIHAGIKVATPKAKVLSGRINKLGTKAEIALKDLAAKAKEKIPIEKFEREVDNILKDAEITPEKYSLEDLKTPQGRQRIIEKEFGLDRETPEGRQAIIEETFATGERPALEPVIEEVPVAPPPPEPRAVVSGAPTVRETNLASRQLLERPALVVPAREIPAAAQRIMDAAREATARRRETPIGVKGSIEENIQQIRELAARAAPEERAQMAQTLKDRGMDKRVIESVEEPPSVQKLNKAQPENNWRQQSDVFKDSLRDDLSVAEDMGIYAEVREMIERGDKVGAIMKEVKQKPYYAEDLRDFGFDESDVRRAIQAIKIREFNDQRAIAGMKNRIAAEEAEVAEIARAVEPEVPAGIERVDPETGRPPGGFEAPERPRDLGTRDIMEEFQFENRAITDAAGEIITSRKAAVARAREIGREGQPVRDPETGGWKVKRTLAEKKAAEAELVREWEQVLREEETGDLRDPEFVELDEGSYFKDVFDVLMNEEGAITLKRAEMQKLKDLVKRGMNQDVLIKTLRARGVEEQQIGEMFPETSVRILNKGTSEFLPEGADPLEPLPRRNYKGREMPEINRGQAHVMATMEDLPPRLTAEHLSFENPLRTFERLGKDVKETWYRPVKEGEKLVQAELKNLQKETKALRRSVPFTSHKRIGIHAIAEQADGLAVLKQQGITKIPKLNEAELKVYNALREKYREFYDRVNDARVASGEARFPAVDNYFTWVQDLGWLEKNFGIGMFSNMSTINNFMNKHGRVPGFRFAKARAGEERPRKLELNPFTAFDTYANSAVKYIHMGPRLAKLNELLLERFKVKENAPNAWSFMRQWLDFQTGKIPDWDLKNPKTTRALRKLNQNLAYSILAGNLRSALIQPSAMKGSFVELGPKFLGEGVAKSLSPSRRKFAENKSNVLLGRSFDASVFEGLEPSGKLPAHVQKNVAEAGLWALKKADGMTATATWLGAFEKARAPKKKGGLGLGEREAINWADDTVTRTQASATPSDIAPIQRTAIGKAITGLQTFVINEWGYLTQDVLGMKNADINNKAAFRKVMNYVIATALINTFYEDVLGLNAPNPTPIRAYKEAIEEGKGSGDALASAAFNMTELVPIIGGSVKFESELGGPLANSVMNLLREGSEGKIDYQEAVRLLGVPGANQLFKMIRAYEKDGTVSDVILGRFVEDVKKHNARPRRAGRQAR